MAEQNKRYKNTHRMTVKSSDEIGITMLFYRIPLKIINYPILDSV